MANFDQERFNAAVMNWISEASIFLYHDVAKNDGGKKIKIIVDATQQCWNAYGRDTTIIPPKPEPEKKNVPTLNSKLSSAEICRANGWVAGDILTTDSEQVTTRILITSVGEKILLARAYSADNAAVGEEAVFLLQYCDWNREPPEGTQPPAAPVVEKAENCDTSAAPVATGDTTREPVAIRIEELLMDDLLAIARGSDPPPPALTDAEREAIEYLAGAVEAGLLATVPAALRLPVADTLRNLLARLGGDA